MFVRSLVLQGIASAEATLTGDEREMGVMMLDIGAGTTDVVIYRQGAPWFSDVLPVGGYSLTRDLAAALGSSLQVAEDIKIHHGTVYPDNLPDDDEVDIPEMQKHWQRPIPRKALAEPLNARMVEILKLALTRVKQAGLQEWPIGGIVMTGGGSQMEGLAELVRGYRGRTGAHWLPVRNLRPASAVTQTHFLRSRWPASVGDQAPGQRRADERRQVRKRPRPGDGGSGLPCGAKPRPRPRQPAVRRGSPAPGRSKPERGGQ